MKPSCSITVCGSVAIPYSQISLANRDCVLLAGIAVVLLLVNGLSQHIQGRAGIQASKKAAPAPKAIATFSGFDVPPDARILVR